LKSAIISHVKPKHVCVYNLEKPVRVEVIGQIQQFKDIKESTMVSETELTLDCIKRLLSIG
jgi:hypothetical protein